MTIRILLAAFGLCVAAASAHAQGVYLFDIVKRPTYKASWDAMLRGQTVDRWLPAMRGPADVMKTVNTSDGPRELGNICKQHDCGDNQFYVLFADGGRRAVGLLQVANKPPRFFGGPTPGERTALLAAAR
jgi:Inhibitor of vertebrate lysozyme (Ivy)